MIRKQKEQVNSSYNEGQNSSLYEELCIYTQKDYYPFHMPGHKRRLMEMVNPYQIDITEIEGFDDLHHPEGILKLAQEEAAFAYGSSQSWYLINGSTAGILSAISAAVPLGGHLLMARNCHRSAYHAAFIRNLQVSYLYPVWMADVGCYGGVEASCVEEALKADDSIAAVCIVSPTYEGIVSDIHTIAEICHQHGVVLIVDEAHGAHFPFHKQYPVSALYQGADVVIQSLHKTLPSLTQTAILHLVGDRISSKRICRYLDIYQTSSPSYVLMSSIQNCIKRMNSEEGRTSMQEFVIRLDKLHKQLQQMQYLQIMDNAFFSESEKHKYRIYDIDSSKLVILAPSNVSMNGVQLYNILLEKYHLQAEMCTQRYVVLMTSVNDSQEGFERLAAALLEIDAQIAMQSVDSVLNSLETKAAGGGYPVIVMTAAQADVKKQEQLPLKDCKDRISGEYLYIYPPGIPVVVPGERVTITVLEICLGYQRCGLKLRGLTQDGRLSVLENEFMN